MSDKEDKSNGSKSRRGSRSGSVGEGESHHKDNHNHNHKEEEDEKKKGHDETEGGLRRWTQRKSIYAKGKTYKDLVTERMMEQRRKEQQLDPSHRGRPTDPLKEGSMEFCLYSRDPNAKRNWEKRWFLLTNEELLFYKTKVRFLQNMLRILQKSDAPVGVICLSSAAVELIEEKSKKNTFKLSAPKSYTQDMIWKDSAYIFVAETPDELKHWIDCIKKVLRKLHKSDSNSTDEQSSSDVEELRNAEWFDHTATSKLTATDSDGVPKVKLASLTLRRKKPVETKIPDCMKMLSVYLHPQSLPRHHEWSLPKFISIFKHFMEKYNFDKKWYPEDKKFRDKIDDIISWDLQSAVLEGLKLTVFDKLNKPGTQPSQYKVNNSMKDIGKVLSRMDTELKNRKFIAGDEASFADLLWFPHVMSLKLINYDFSKMSHLRRWYQELPEQLSTIKLMQEEFTLTTKELPALNCYWE